MIPKPLLSVKPPRGDDTQELQPRTLLTTCIQHRSKKFLPQALARVSSSTNLGRGLQESCRFLLSQTRDLLFVSRDSGVCLSLLEGGFQFRGNCQATL